MLKTICILLVSALIAGAALAADISGTWHVNVETDAGSGTPTFVLKQTGDQLSGTYSGALGEAKVTGSIKGDKVEFGFAVDAGKVTYSGTLESDSKMKGTVKLGDLGSGTFTATKSPGAAPFL